MMNMIYFHFLSAVALFCLCTTFANSFLTDNRISTYSFRRPLDNISARKSKGLTINFVSATETSEDESITDDKVDKSKRGDARGAVLLVENVSVFRGPAKILNNINWRVEPSQKWALIGSNGAGKSTLLKAIVGEMTHDGSIIVGTKEKMGYLKQTAVSGSDRTIYETACSGMTVINEARNRMENAVKSGNLDDLEDATSQFEALGGYKQDQKVATVLKGLGFTNFNIKCSELSGGWQMRVSFARQLLSEPTLSLLDEPGKY